MERLSAPSSPVNMPPTHIEELCKGCIGGRENMSIAILGGSGQGKSYTARYLIEELHKRNKYKHFLMITNEGSYINPENVIANVSNVWQTIWWNKIKQDDYKNVNNAIRDKCTEWAKGYTSQQTLVVIDDVSTEITNGGIEINNLVTRGYHMRTDVIIVYHGIPKAQKPAIAPLRENLEGVILTGTDFVKKIYDLTEWFDTSMNKDIEVVEHCKNFVVPQQTQAFINRRLCRQGKSLQEYCVPIASKLHNVDLSLEKQARWTIGSEPDAKDIIRGTDAFESIKEYALELHKSLEAQHNSVFYLNT